MSERETAKAISEAAARWVARVDRSGDEAEMLAELDGWLAGDERRQGAYFRARSAWAMLDRASALAGGRQERDDRVWPSRRQILWGGSAAAASLAMILVGTRGPRSMRIETAIGEIRRVPLKDGSMAAVNTDSRLSVALKPEIRQIALEQGEAWFQVAHDRTRPFVVEAGDVRVRAVGTAFSVRRTDTGADVQVTEGVVVVWRAGSEGDARRVSAGARTFVGTATGPQSPVEASTQIDRSLAWRSGQLIFDGDTLGAAAAEFNRYNTIKVRIADPSLASEKFVGRFRTNESSAFAEAAAKILGARAEVGVNEIVVSRE